MTQAGNLTSKNTKNNLSPQLKFTPGQESLVIKLWEIDQCKITLEKHQIEIDPSFKFQTN
jgi:hypothetical protein